MIDRTEDRKIGHRILNNVRRAIERAAGGDSVLHSLGSVIFAPHATDGRARKKAIKDRLYEKNPRCHKCKKKFETKRGVHLHRKNEDRGYTDKNCVLMHAVCHREHHRK